MCVNGTLSTLSYKERCPDDKFTEVITVIHVCNTQPWGKHTFHLNLHNLYLLLPESSLFVVFLFQTQDEILYYYSSISDASWDGLHKKTNN